LPNSNFRVPDLVSIYSWIQIKYYFCSGNRNVPVF
jgi:hypothetical protein